MIFFFLGYTNVTAPLWGRRCAGRRHPLVSHYSGLPKEQGTLSCMVSCTSSNRIGRRLIATEPDADESDCCLEVIFVRILRELVFNKPSDFFFLEEKKKLYKR